jgi:hypothetical protein
MPAPTTFLFFLLSILVSFCCCQLSGALEAAALLRQDVAALEEEKLFARNVENITPHLQRWYRSQAFR